MPKTTVNGVDLGWEIAGQGTEWVVLLNGIAMSVAHWKPVVENLPARYRCFLHDFRGQLLSPEPVAGPGASCRRLEDHVSDLLALMEAAGISRAHVVGTSYGAEVGMLFAVLHPERTTSLAIIDGVSELDPVLKAAVEGWKAAALADPVAFYRSTMAWNYSAAYLAANADALARREAVVAGLPRSWFISFAAMCDAFLRIDLTKDLHRIACPALVLVAENDILKGARFARIIADRIPGARLRVIPEAGHAVVVEKPGEVAAELAAFLGGLEIR